MKLIYSKPLNTDPENRMYIATIETDSYLPQTATRSASGYVRLCVSRLPSAPTLARGYLFPRKELRAIYMHAFMSWASSQDFSGKTTY